MLAEKVRERQLALGWHDRQMADAIGIPRTTYNAVFKTHTHRISLNVTRCVVAAFPDLAPFALLDPDPPERPYRERWNEEPGT